jgi:hypothetical protein
MPELYFEKVKLNHENHVYTDDSGRVYESLSRVRSCIKDPFDSHGLSLMTAKKRGISQAEVLGEWKATAKVATDHGTRIHNALELYQNSAAVLPENEDLRPMLVAVSSLYKDYYAVHQEKTLYDEEYGIAGTADTICVTTRSKNSILDLTDFKTSKSIYYESKYKKYLLGKFSHLQDCNYVDYAIQLSSYAYMAEKLTGRKIGTLNIIHIPESNPLAFKVIPVPYMRMEIQVLFDTYRELKHIKIEEGIKGESQIIIPNF